MTPMTGTSWIALQLVERGGRGGVARHDHQLHVVLAHEEVADLRARSPRTVVERPGPVRIAPGVADVDEVLVGQQVDQRTSNGEPAEPAVEHADGPVVHDAPG